MLEGAGVDKVLTTDASGVATWQEAGGGWDGIIPNYTTAQRNALSLVDGLIVFNTTDNAVQIYKSDAWANVGAKLSLAATCSLDGDCDSTHCVDGVCCLTTCDGNCNRCNVAGSEGTCTDTNSDCTGNCDVCASGNCSGVSAMCTGTCTECTGSGTAYSCTFVANGLTGLNCTEAHYRCNGSGACTRPCSSTQVCYTAWAGHSCTDTCSPEHGVACGCVSGGYNTYNCTRVVDCFINSYSCKCYAWVY